MKSLRFPIITAMALTIVAAGACGSSQPVGHASPSSTLPHEKLALARAGGAARPSADSGTAAIYPAPAQKYIVDSPLPDLGSEAPAWRMSARTVDLHDAQRIADAVGIPGTPAPTATGWSLHAGTAAFNVDQSHGTVTIIYAAHPAQFADGSSGSSGSGSGSATTGVATPPPDTIVNGPAIDVTKPVAPTDSTPPVPGPTTTPETVAPRPAPVDVPNATDAQSIVQDLLDRAGVLDGQKWSVAVDNRDGVTSSCAPDAYCSQPVEQVRSRTVTFSLVVDGNTINDFNWSVTIGEHRRVDSLYGEWDTAVTLGPYGLRSTAAVLADVTAGKARYSTPQPVWGNGASEAGSDIAPEPASPGIPPATAPAYAPDSPTEPAPDVHITGVSLGLARWNATGDDGKPVTDLLPTYRFRAVVAGGTPYDIEVLALDPAGFTIS